jgi:uncharacterized membrane protein YkoI
MKPKQTGTGKRAAFAAALVLCASAIGAQAFTGKQYIKDATVSLEHAREIALKAVPGRIVDEELEKGKGGSGLRYSFDILTGHSRQEIWVDAKTGKVLRQGK